MTRIPPNTAIAADLPALKPFLFICPSIGAVCTRPRSRIVRCCVICRCNQIIIIKEGSGDNLSREDMEDGFVDYIYYTQYSLNDGDIKEIDGGMILQKTYLAETYSSLRLVISDVLEMAYDSKYTPYVMLNKKEEG